MTEKTLEPLLSIVIVSYNTGLLTLQTLKSVLENISSSALLRRSTEVFIVDNNSSDNSVSLVTAELKKAHHLLSRAKVITNKENLGFARANNQAIKLSKGRYVLLLNSDTIVQKNALHTLVTFLDEADVRLGIVAAKLLNPDYSIQFQGGALPTLANVAAHMLFLDDLPILGSLFDSTQYTGKSKRASTSRSTSTQMGWVGGTAMAIKKAVFKEIGLLDQNIFMYGEDMEFCLRAAHHHWGRAILNTAEVVHLGSASSSSANAITGELKGYLYIWSKHQPLWQLQLLRLVLKIGILLRIILFGTMSRNAAKLTAYKQAWKLI